jgi:transaldolase
MFSDSGFLRLAEQGAHKQRIVWASTSTKNPAYPDILYIESLVGAETITTMPVETLAAYRDHGAPELALPGDLHAAQDILAGIDALGTNLQEVSEKLEQEGVQKFCAAYDNLLHTIESRCARPAQAAPVRHERASGLHTGRS